MMIEVKSFYIANHDLLSIEDDQIGGAISQVQDLINVLEDRDRRLRDKTYQDVCELRLLRCMRFNLNQRLKMIQRRS